MITERKYKACQRCRISWKVDQSDVGEQPKSKSKPSWNERGYTVGYNTILSELLLPPYLAHSYAKK